MFYLLTETMHLLGTVTLIFKGSLRDDTTAIERRINVMNSNTKDLNTRLYSLLHGSCTTKSR